MKNISWNKKSWSTRKLDTWRNSIAIQATSDKSSDDIHEDDTNENKIEVIVEACEWRC